SVRAHFLVDARMARVSVESELTEVTGDSHITQVTFGTGERVQAAQLDRQSNRVTFEPMESADLPGASVGNGSADLSVAAFTMNETGVMVLLGLFLLTALPPTFFCALVRRRHFILVRATLPI